MAGAGFCVCPGQDQAEHQLAPREDEREYSRDSHARHRQRQADLSHDCELACPSRPTTAWMVAST